MYFCFEIERDQDSATRLTHVCDPYETATTPDVWEDEISEGEANGDRFDNFITEKVPEAFHFHFQGLWLPPLLTALQCIVVSKIHYNVFCFLLTSGQ